MGEVCAVVALVDWAASVAVGTLPATLVGGASVAGFSGSEEVLAGVEELVSMKGMFSCGLASTETFSSGMSVSMSG